MFGCGQIKGLSRSLRGFLFLLMLTFIPAPSGMAQRNVHLEGYLDGLLEGERRDGTIMGAAVCVVRNGEVLVTKGSGWADASADQEVNPQDTLFEIPRFGDLLIWTSLVDRAVQGELDLEAPVSPLLPGLGAADIRVLDLLSQLSGLEADRLGTVERLPDRLPSLEDLLVRYPPHPVRTPGTLPGYSPRAGLLGARLLEEITGESWQSYLESRVLRPLGMYRSTVRRPLPASIRGDHSRGYHQAEGGLEKLPTGYSLFRPSMGFSSTAWDVGRFMLVHLQQGRLGDEQILHPQTPLRMRQMVFTQPLPLSGGTSAGFSKRVIAGRDAFGLAGGSWGFETQMWLLPEADLGIFVVTNTAGSEDSVEHIVGSLLKEILGSAESDSRSSVEGKPRTEQAGHVGTYLSTEAAESDLTKVERLLGRHLVTVKDRGGRLETSHEGGVTHLWRSKSGGIFQHVRSGELLVFRAVDGKMTAYFEGAPARAYQRLPFYETRVFHFAGLLIAVAILLSTMFLPVLSSFYQDPTRTMLSRPESSHPVARLLAGVLSLLFFILILGLIFLLGSSPDFRYGLSRGLEWLLILPTVCTFLTVVMIILTLLAWRGAYWGLLGRLHFSLVTLACLFLLWQLWFWNLLGWSRHLWET